MQIKLRWLQDDSMYDLPAQLFILLAFRKRYDYNNVNLEKRRFFMNKNKYMDEIEELNSQDTSSPELARKKQSGRKAVKSLFIFVLSVLCVIGIILIHRLHKDAVIDTTNKIRINRMTQPRKVHSQNPVLSPVSTVADTTSSARMSAEKKPVASIGQIPAEVRAERFPQKPMPTLQQATSTADEIPADVSPDSISETVMGITPTIGITVAKSNYSLRDALMFKEHFLKGLSCESDYRKLMNATHKTRQMQSTLNYLSPFCSDRGDMFADIRATFLQNKREALIAMYKLQNPAWLAYIKALFVSVIEVRRLNPKSTKPKDIIYKAQSELYHQNITKAETLLRALPQPMQDAMSDFFREAEIYMRADESLNKLILSFERQGE